MIPWHRWTLALCVVALTSSHSDAQEAPAPMLGFTEERAPGQRELEARFDAALSAENLRDWMQRLTAHPHHVGSPFGKVNAHWIAAQFESWGYDTRLESFHVLFPTPKIRRLEMVRPESFVASLVEPPLAGDETSSQLAEQLPTYNAYSPDGDVTADLVYVNYGVPEDYDQLERLGVDVRGKIVIARYGRSWRGIKPKLAGEKGAVGCVIYSDPRDDGYWQGAVYPAGPFKNPRGVQRGSVADMPLYPGDPLTPHVGATKDAERLPFDEARTLAAVPVMPISHADALPLLKALRGPVAPEEWRGALPITYRIGPGPTRVHLEVAFDWKITPVFDVVARLEGQERPDEWIVRGNHHDAWVNGADDPVSGLVSMMEEARAIGELTQSGWRPKRTIVYAAWDAEEPGLLGSTEWVETHADVLAENVAVYINTDSNGRGFLNAGGSHTLERLFNEIARDVRDPQRGVSVAERARSRRLVQGGPAERSLTAAGELRLSALGSGSDYTPFLQHLGIASLNLGFGGENRGGEYHSIYDSFDHYTRFGDPDFAYGVTLAKVAGRFTLRLADSDVLPFEFERFTGTVSEYVNELEELVDRMRTETDREIRLIEEGHYVNAADPTESYVPPAVKGRVPHINLAPLNNSLSGLKRASERFTEAWIDSRGGATLPLDRRRDLDRLLYGSERALTRAEGLPGRPWFRHHIYAPGFYTGYGVKTLPAVREAIEQREWEEAEKQSRITANVLAGFARQVDAAADLLERFPSE